MKAIVKSLNVLRFDHPGGTIEAQYTDMGNVHWSVHVAGYSKSNVPCRPLLLTRIMIKQEVLP